MNLRQFYKTWISPQRWLERAGVGAPMQLAAGLVLLTICVFLFARALRLAPNPAEAVLDRQTVLAEMASAYVSYTVAKGDTGGGKEFLDSLVRRYDDVLSAALRRSDGTIVVETADHENLWSRAQRDSNASAHLQVPLYQGQKIWGLLEISFRPEERDDSPLSLLATPAARWIAFMIAGSFLLFWLFLSRILRILDPTAAVPDGTQLLMDTLVEGMVILDDKGQIVMSNQSFASSTFLPLEQLIGRKLSSLPWMSHRSGATPDDYPWEAVRQSDLPQRGVPMRLQIGARHIRRLILNASPIVDPRGVRQGVLVTFADQTIIESENLRLLELTERFSERERVACSP